MRSQSAAVASQWRLWGRSVTFILVAGVCFSIASFRMVRGWEARSAREEFHLAATTSGYAIQKEIESDLGALRALHAYLNVTPNPGIADFGGFAEELIRSNPSILSLEWAPRIKERERAAFERELVQRGSTHPYIRKSLAANPAPADAAKEYFPVEFMSPATETERVVGFDLGSSKLIEGTLEQARESKRLTVGGKVMVVETSHDRVAMPSYMAVFEGEPGHDTIRGYALGLFQIGEVIERGLQRLKPEAIDIEFYDLSAAPGRRFLYRHQWESDVPALRFKPENEALADGDFKHVVRFDVGGRQWAMAMTATSAYKLAHRTWLPWGTLAISLLVTGAAMTHFLLHITHARRDEELKHLRSRKETEDALRASEERFALAARGSKDGLWDWDLVTGQIFYSERWKSMLGCSGAEIGNSPDDWTSRLYPADRARVENEIAQHCNGQTNHFQSEYRIRHSDGSYRWMLSRGVAVTNENGVATRIAGSQTDITENKAADHLTGLASRLLLDEKLQLAIDQARMDPNEQFAVLFLDLDRFKVINDSLGHMAGDRLLKETAERLLGCVTSPPFADTRTLIARSGGDEFVILIAGLSDSALPMALANRIQEAMRCAFSLEGHQMFVSTSIGVRIGHGNETPETLLRDADTAMYYAKTRGKQRNELFVPAMRQAAVERLRVETDLRKAIEEDQLVVYYQPKVCLATGAVAELEALVRWIHPQQGLVYPADFIPLADETGLILPLGRQVLKKACGQMAAWLKEGGVSPAMRVSVNLSCKQFNQPDLFEEIVGVLEETGLAADRLSLEVTEGVLMENVDNAVALLNRLREKKIGLQIDDFGTGYSSLNYLHRLPFDALKIDRSFVREIGLRRENAEIVSTVMLLGRTLGMSVVAEGVETMAQLAQLMDFGCDYAQGHLFSEAVDAETARRLFKGFEQVLNSVPSRGDRYTLTTA